MAEKKSVQLGFDLPKAIESLRAAAVTAGAFPPTDPRAQSPHHVAEAHVHGVENARHCRRHQCRLAGVCLALSEILIHEADIENLKPFFDAAAHADEVSVNLSRAQKGAEAATVLLEANAGALQAGEGEKRTPVEQAVLMVRATAVIRKHAEALAQGLRANAWSKHHQQPRTKKRSDLLLTAVWQHLDWGGLTYEEIFELVPGYGSCEAERRRARADQDQERALDHAARAAPGAVGTAACGETAPASLLHMTRRLAHPFYGRDHLRLRAPRSRNSSRSRGVADDDRSGRLR